ncbi:hypothetical protein FQN54_005371 [Arachnomyces sp. PD_36]|nr:hypothetical protein FQN54_005371 [Arachnomyces sp. PD_36]
MKLLAYFILLAPLCLGREYYFDGSAPGNGSGTQSSPYNDLTSISKLEVAGGDSILLKRGSSFTGSLVLNQGGAAGSSLTVGAYGDEAAALPVISAGDNLNAVLVNGTSYITIQDLEITNPGDNTTPRRGVYVLGLDAGNVQDITLQNLYIHDVRGYMPSTTDTGIGTGKYSNASGGIVIEAAGNDTATYFTNVLVQDNEIRSVDRQGIYTWTNWCRREEMATFWEALCFQDWKVSTGLLVQRNRLYDIGGDGIVVHGYESGLVKNNIVKDFNKRSKSPNAGVWTANSINAMFQYNTVSGGTTTSDGMSYDVDHSCSGAVFEYNVSHDNEGGFFLLCPYDKPTTNFTIRYNLSVNDKARGFQVCDGALEGGQIYKNTMYIGDGITSNLFQEETTSPLDVAFTNNIVLADGTGNYKWALEDSSVVVDNNILAGSIDAYSGATNTITDRPGLAAPGLRDPKAYLLLEGSPSLDSATTIKGDASEDFFSNPTTRKNLGFYAGSKTNIPVWISDFDDSDLSAWTSTGSPSVEKDPAGDLGSSVKLPPGAVLSRDIETSIPYRVNARVWAGDGGASSVKVGSSEVKLTGSVQNRSIEWQILEVQASTGGVKATLDGAELTISAFDGNGSSISFTAGDGGLFVDDVFVTST